MTLDLVRTEFLFCLRHPRVRTSLAAFAASMVFLAGIGAFYWWPAMNRASHLQAQIAEIRQQIFNADFSTRLTEAYERASRQVAQAEKKLDAASTQTVLVQNLAALARKHGVRIVSESYEEGKPKEGYAPLVHQLTLQGGYAELRGFITGLQDLPTLTIVQEASIGRVAGANAIKAQLSMVTYRRTLGKEP